jgi:VWFA-related protein
VKLIAFAIALSAATLSLLAQEKIEVHLVEVPVTVIDRAGNPVRGLTSANFELFDNGRRQKITAFDAIDFTSTASLSAISPLNPNARRSFLLLFDLGYSSIKAIVRARVAARQFITANVQPRDLVAVGLVDPQRGFQLLTSFTTDRSLLAAAIDETQLYHGTDPLQLSNLDSFGRALSFRGTSGSAGGVDNGGNGGGAGGGGRFTGEADEQLRGIKRATAQQNRYFASGQLRSETDAFHDIAALLRTVPGRRQVVLLSGGFDASLVRGRPARGTMRADLNDMARAVSGQAYLIDNDARFGNNTSLTDVERLVSVFKHSDAVMNAIDIEGIGVDDSPSAKPAAVSNDALHLLTDPTGGTVFENSNDLHSDFERMMHQQEVVYVLSFQAEKGRPGKEHTLTVNAVGVPHAEVHNRVAYYEPGRETAFETALSNAEIIVNDIPQRDIRVAALAAAVPAPDHSPVSLFVEINGEDFLRSATKAPSADVFIYAFDEQGVVRDRVYERIAVDSAKAGAAVREKGIKYLATLALPPGRYAIRTLVSVPDTLKRGFARTDLLVPGATNIALLPPLFADKPGQWAMLSGVQHDTTPYPFQLDGERFVPSATPVVRATEGRANADDVTIQATVTDSAGAMRPASPTLARQIAGDSVTKLVFHYDPAGLPAGPATLNVTLSKKGSAEMNKASIALIVAK